ncbi:MAG: sensor histidine kinase [Bacteroidetes bacterium]|nr:sensor histidine kinase [Bacteroidota bacterium]
MYKLFSQPRYILEFLFQALGLSLAIFFYVELWNNDWLNTNPIEKVAFSFIFLAAITTFYGNTYGFIPRFLSKKKWLKYLLVLFIFTLTLELCRALILALCTIKNELGTSFSQIFADRFLGPLNVSGAVLLGLIISLAYSFSRDWILNLSRIEKLEKERTKMELALLKSQLDPHFLFNTLNNLYGLALEEGSPKTANSIAKLGTLMRYNLHDASNPSISLNKEIEYLEKYMDLQLLRLGPNVELRYENSLSDTDQSRFQIAPVLLVSFLENAFKYGNHPVEEREIYIQLSLNEDVLKMEIANDFQEKISASNASGIGLKNVQKRLQLLYPKKHELKFGKTAENKFRVDLKLELKQ